MNIFIQKQNEGFFKTLLKGIELKFYHEIDNTSTFRVNENEFQQIYNKLKEKGYNPYRLMSW